MTAVLENDTNTTGRDTFAQTTDNTTRHKHILHACKREWLVQRNGNGRCSAGPTVPSPGDGVARTTLASTAAWCLNDGDDRIPTAIALLQSSALGELQASDRPLAVRLPFSLLTLRDRDQCSAKHLCIGLTGDQAML